MSSSTDIPSNSFKPASSRRKKRNRLATVTKPVTFSSRMERASARIIQTSWAKECQKKVETFLTASEWDPPEVLCLGLGSPRESDNAAAQLALLVSLCDASHIARDRVSLFDPQFSQEDIEGLREMGFNVLSENKCGKYALKGRTLLYMPHCGVELYENILRENWDVEALQRFLLLGNTLQVYETETPAQKFEQETPCLFHICKYLTCDSVSPCEAYPFAFTSLGVQYVAGEALPLREDGLWKLPLPNPDKKPSAEIA